MNTKRLAWYLLLIMAYCAGGLLAVPVVAWLRGGG